MEEEAKRRTLLRYIHAVKAAASLGVDEHSHKSMAAAVGRPGRGIIQVMIHYSKEAHATCRSSRETKARNRAEHRPEFPPSEHRPYALCHTICRQRLAHNEL